MGLFIANGVSAITPPEVITNEVLSRHNVYGVEKVARVSLFTVLLIRSGFLLLPPILEWIHGRM